jgi:dihydropteroate synthase
VPRPYDARVAAPLEQRLPGPVLMGIVNVTPDSFSDGGRFLDHDAAIAEALRQAADGAAIVDIGGESTRPGSVGVPIALELARVLPVIESVRAQSDVAISVDTSKAEVARRAIDAGATMVNDVTALRGDPELAAVVAQTGVDLCLMHMQGTPRTMQDDPQYGDVVEEVAGELAAQLAVAVRAGVDPVRICVDPGIGFGKNVQHNLSLLAGVPRLAERTGRPVLVGVSRKRFLGSLVGDLERDRAVATVVAGLAALDRGAWGLRVHDVREHADALAVRAAIGPLP